MKRYIPYEKLSKKEQRKIDLSHRGSWGDINPVTRKPENSKAYNRKKTRNWRHELPHSGSLFFMVIWVSFLPCRF